MKLLRKISNKGQVAVEYVLMLAAISAILFAVFQKLEGKISGDPEACEQGGTINPVCFIKELGLDGSNEVSPTKYRNFNLR